MNFGNKIIALRKKYNYTQEQLAEKVGVTRQTLSNWESDITAPDLTQASILCKELKINLNDLVDNNVELDVKDNSNRILNKLIDKEVTLTFSFEYFYDTDIGVNSKVKVLGINDEFIKVEVLRDKKKVIKLIDMNLVESIKLVEEY